MSFLKDWRAQLATVAIVLAFVIAASSPLGPIGFLAVGIGLPAYCFWGNDVRESISGWRYRRAQARLRN